MTRLPFGNKKTNLTKIQVSSSTHYNVIINFGQLIPDKLGFRTWLIIVERLHEDEFTADAIVDTGQIMVKVIVMVTWL